MGGKWIAAMDVVGRLNDIVARLGACLSLLVYVCDHLPGVERGEELWDPPKLLPPPPTPPDAPPVPGGVEVERPTPSRDPCWPTVNELGECVDVEIETAAPRAGLRVYTAGELTRRADELRKALEEMVAALTPVMLEARRVVETAPELSIARSLGRKALSSFEHAYEAVAEDIKSERDRTRRGGPRDH